MPMDTWGLTLEHVDLDKIDQSLRNIILKKPLVTMGRWLESDYKIPSKYSTRKKAHLQLIVTPSTLKIIPNETMNSTFVNGVEIPNNHPFTLAPGDKIGIGVSTLSDVHSFIYVVRHFQNEVLDPSLIKTKKEEDDECVILSDDNEASARETNLVNNSSANSTIPSENLNRINGASTSRTNGATGMVNNSATVNPVNSSFVDKRNHKSDTSSDSAASSAKTSEKVNGAIDKGKNGRVAEATHKNRPLAEEISSASSEGAVACVKVNSAIAKGKSGREAEATLKKRPSAEISSASSEGAVASRKVNAAMDKGKSGSEAEATHKKMPSVEKISSASSECAVSSRKVNSAIDNGKICGSAQSIHKTRPSVEELSSASREGAVASKKVSSDKGKNGREADKTRPLEDKNVPSASNHKNDKKSKGKSKVEETNALHTKKGKKVSDSSTDEDMKKKKKKKPSLPAVKPCYVKLKRLSSAEIKFHTKRSKKRRSSDESSHNEKSLRKALLNHSKKRSSEEGETSSEKKSKRPSLSLSRKKKSSESRRVLNENRMSDSSSKGEKRKNSFDSPFDKQKKKKSSKENAEPIDWQNVTIKSEPIADWDYSQYDLEEDDDICIIEPVEAYSQQNSTQSLDASLDSEFNPFLNSHKEGDTLHKPSSSQPNFDSLIENVSDDSLSSEDAKVEEHLTYKTSLDMELDAVSDSPEEPTSDGHLSDVSSSDEFEKQPQSGKRKSGEVRSTQFTLPLPCVQRGRGRQPGKLHPRPQPAVSEKLKPVKPKHQYADQFRSLVGQKPTKKSWIPDAEYEDREVRKSIKEQRAQKLRELEKSKSYKDNRIHKKSTIRNEQEAFSMEDTSGSKAETSKVPVKVTKTNRGAFLTETVPQTKKSSTVMEKVDIQENITIVTNVKPTVEKTESFVIPKKLSFEDYTSRFANNKPSLAEPKSKPALPRIPKKTSSKDSEVELTSKSAEPTESPKKSSSSKVPEVESTPGLSSSAQPKSKPTWPRIPKKTSSKEYPEVDSTTPVLSASVQPSLKTCIATGTKAGKKVEFNLNTLQVKTYVIPESHPKMVPYNAAQKMERSPLLDMGDAGVMGVDEETDRVIRCVTKWNVKWMQTYQQRTIPPPLWRSHLILYKRSELDKMIQERGTKNVPLAPPEDKTAVIVVPPKACTIRFPHYHAYHKEWLKLMLLEIWGTISSTFLNSVTLDARVGSWTCSEEHGPWKQAEITIELTKDLIKRCQEYPRSGDFIILDTPMPAGETRQGGSSQDNRSRRIFGYIENDRLVESQGNGLLKMHPITSKPIISTLTLYVLTKDCEVVENCSVKVLTLLHVRKSLKMIQGLFELSSSPLRDVILCPSVETLKADPVTTKPELKSLGPLRGIQEVMMAAGIPLSQKQVQIAVRLANTLGHNKPSLSVVEGPPGTGKTRTMLAAVIRFLLNNEKSSRLGQRILICTSSMDSVNALAFLLDIIIKRFANFTMVVAGVERELNGAAYEHSLQKKAREKEQRDNMQEEREETENMMESDPNIIQATINREKLNVEYIKSKNKYDAKQHEKCIQSLEERYKRIKSGRVHPDTENNKMKNERRLRDILRHTHVILCTYYELSSDLISSAFGSNKSAQMPICLIDDAQTVPEIYSLMPLVCGTSRLVLVGDLNLPYCNLHFKKASELGLSTPLLSRVTKSLCKIDLPEEKFDEASLKGLTYHRLTKHYRMPPDLCDLYLNALTLKDMEPTVKPKRSDWPMQQFVILNHNFPVENEHGSPEWLTEEARLAFKIIHLSEKLTEKLDPGKGSINAIVVEQDEVIGNTVRQLFERNYKRKANHCAWAQRLDSCCGLEANVVVVCLGQKGSPFENHKQLLLAMSRTKCTFVVVGHLEHFKEIPVWKNVLTFAEDNKVCHDVTARTTDQQLCSFLSKNRPAPPQLDFPINKNASFL